MNELMKVGQEKHEMMYRDPAAVAAAESAKARIQSAYIMAYQKPRSEDQARIRILEACRRPTFAERVEYNKPVGGRGIKGPSIRFAELALREWGNILTETQVLYEDETIRRTRVTVIDLETNATFSKDIQLSKTVERKSITPDRELVGQRQNTYNQTVYIVRATDEELQNKEAAAISKAIRNEGLRIIPSDIVDEALDVARETITHRDSQDPAAAKKKVLDSFATIGVKPKDLEKLLKHGLDTVSPAELGELRQVFQTIKQGEATWAEYITPQEGEDGKLKTQADGIKEKLSKRGRPKAAEKPQEAPTPEQAQSPTPEGQKPVQAITAATIAKIRELEAAQDIPEQIICDDYHVSSLEELTEKDGLKAIEFYSKS